MTNKLLSVRGPGLLLAAVLSAVGASICCLLPFLLLATGLGGAWLSNLMLIEPYQPILIALSLGLILAGGWQLMRPAVCANRTDSSNAILDVTPHPALVTSAILVLVLISSEYWIPFLAGL